MNDRDQRELLVRLVAGDVAPDDAEVMAMAARDVVFAASVDELLAVRAQLEAAAGAERRLLEVGAPPAGRDVVADTLRQLAAGVPRPERNRPGRVLRLAVAAAVVVLLAAAALWLQRSVRGTNDDDRTIGASKLELQATGSLTTGLVLSWESSVPATFRVEIYDPRAPGSSPLLERDETKETQWRIDPSSLRNVTPMHRWRVTARFRGGEVVRDGPLPR